MEISEPSGEAGGYILTRTSSTDYIKSLDGFRLERRLVDARLPSWRKSGSLLAVVHYRVGTMLYQAPIESFKKYGEILKTKGVTQYYVLPTKYFLVIDLEDIVNS